MSTPEPKQKPLGLVARARALLDRMCPIDGIQSVETDADGEDRDSYYRRMAKSGFLGKRVLVLEDNDACRDILAMLLSRWGMEVTVAVSCREAMHILAQEREPFHFAVLDHTLPDGTGDQVARSLRAMGRAKALSLISLTGNRFLPDLSLYHASIAKPATPEGLRETLVDLLAGEANSPALN